MGERQVEEIFTVPRYIEIPRIIQRKQNTIVQQPQRTVESVQETVVERIVERRRPVVNEVVRTISKTVEVPQIQTIQKWSFKGKCKSRLLLCPLRGSLRKSWRSLKY